MPKFAHMSDIHIGAFRQPELKSLVLDAFEAALDRCVEEKVEFVILAGDIFDSNIPDLASVRRAAEKMREVSEAGIRLYAIYGSHDFSPNYSSMVDVLDGAGLFTKAERLSRHGDVVRLSFLADPAGPKLCGISGRKLSIDRDDYAMLDKERLEQEPGFKVFVFHGALDELKPRGLEKMEGMPAASLPSGFDYYAGGHVHGHGVASLPGRENIVYPGPLFATDFSELAELARGGERGFYVVDFDEEGVRGIRFVPVKVCEVEEIRYSAEGKSSREAAEELAALASRSEVGGKVALLTVEGRLSEGRTSDMDLAGAKRRIAASGPIVVLSNYSHLSSYELDRKPPAPRPARVTERELFEREISRVKSDESRLTGERGVALAVDLLDTLKEGKKENENKGEFQHRTLKAGLGVFGLEEVG